MRVQIPPPALKMKFFLLLLLGTHLKFVSLAPSVTEIIYYLGIDSVLVGNTIYCDFPKEAKKKVHVGDLINPNIETIKKLNPDYVITVSPMQDQLKIKLKKAGLKVISCQQNSFDDIAECIRKIGELAGNKTGYIRFVKKLQSLDTLSRLDKKILFVLSEKPMYAAGKNTFINEIIEKAGATNAATFDGYKMISPEIIRSINPDIIIITGEKASAKDFSGKIGIKNTKASKHHCIFTVDADLFTRPGPRVIQATLHLRKILESCTKDGKNQ